MELSLDWPSLLKLILRVILSSETRAVEDVRTRSWVSADLGITKLALCEWPTTRRSCGGAGDTAGRGKAVLFSEEGRRRLNGSEIGFLDPFCRAMLIPLFQPTRPDFPASLGIPGSGSNSDSGSSSCGCRYAVRDWVADLLSSPQESLVARLWCPTSG